jgi:glycerol-3-phosphate dehydrogenase
MAVRTDILIVGGGIGGASIARELSRYKLDVTLLEKEADLGWGQTKASYAIRHPGVRWSPGTLAWEMIARSNQTIDQLLEELDVDFRNCGELILAFDDAELECLKAMQRQGERLCIEGLEIIDETEIRHMEPNVSTEAIAALSLPTAGVFNPFDLIHAFSESALNNGVRIKNDTEVLAIVPEGSGFTVETNQKPYSAHYVINAAGLFAQKVARMVGDESFEIDYATKSTCFILDNMVGDTVHRIITGLTDLRAFTRFRAVMPTYGGNILLYTPIAESADGIDDRGVAPGTLQKTCESARTLIPDFDFERYVITSFSGLTARNNRNDFIVEAAKECNRFVHVALPPPGITCSPVIGKRVVEILKASGLILEKKAHFNPFRKRPPSIRTSSPDEMRRLVDKDANYGKIVCRCEKVSEGEIMEAISRGASSMDGIKFRTRAGMGRCQGNFCGPQLVDILARETKCPREKITKKGVGSHVIQNKGCN